MPGWGARGVGVVVAALLVASAPASGAASLTRVAADDGDAFGGFDMTATLAGVDDATVQAITSASGCGDDAFRADPDDDRLCGDLAASAAQLVADLGPRFTDADVLATLAGAGLLARLPDSDGHLLLPTVTRLVPVLVLLAVRGGVDSDQRATTTLHRLIALAAALDIGS